MGQRYEIERIAIIGAAYASIFYGMDSESVFFVADGERAGRLEREGVLVNGRPYSIPVHRPGEPSQPADLIIVAVKNHHLDTAIDALRDSVGYNTVILSLMNGIDSEGRIGWVYGAEKVLYSMVLGIDAVRVRNEVRYSVHGRIFFGEAKNLTYTDRVMRVKNLFDRAGIAYVIPEDMIRALWWKFMINVGINQASAALRSTYALFQIPGESQVLMESAMREVATIAGKLDIHLSEEDIRDWYDVLSKLSAEGKTSMLQDVEAGRKTEVEMFSGKVIELGKKLGVPTPVNERLFRLIRDME
jgi:2-dehydropantoate 2-reductase